MSKAVVLRWGHRHRDERLTTHVALTARALGASGLILTDVKDERIKKTIDEVVSKWGGPFFFKMGVSWKAALRDWRAKDGLVVHLTAYGENIQVGDVIQRVKETGKDILVIVGSQKVPSEFFSPEISDFNIAIGNQPHSECASLAVFLDRLFKGKIKKFEDAVLQIIPQKHGKKVISKVKPK